MWVVTSIISKNKGHTYCYLYIGIEALIKILDFHSLQ
uniref:Uncharacterized protein n=1 Tax=Lepeophtheirus salmonis TaxID=72036 RepID=A0A0K2T9R8_LEPSM